MNIIARSVTEDTMFNLIQTVPEGFRLFLRNPYGSDILDQSLFEMVYEIYTYYSYAYIGGDVLNPADIYNYALDRIPLWASERAEEFEDFLNYEPAVQNSISQTDREYYTRMIEFAKGFGTSRNMFEHLYADLHLTLSYPVMQWIIDWSHAGRYFNVVHVYILEPNFYIQFSQTNFIGGALGIHLGENELGVHGRRLLELSKDPVPYENIIKPPQLPVKGTL